MSEGKSAIEYLMEYGWILLVLAIVGGASYVEFQPSQEDPKINTTQVSSFLEERTGYSDCTVERAYEKTRADATCTRDIGEHENMSFESGKKFTAEMENGSIMILEDYRY